MLQPSRGLPWIELERDLELERRKAAGLQDSLKDRDKEYQKLKVLAGTMISIVVEALMVPTYCLGTVRQDQAQGPPRSQCRRRGKREAWYSKRRAPRRTARPERPGEQAPTRRDVRARARRRRHGCRGGRHGSARRQSVFQLLGRIMA